MDSPDLFALKKGIKNEQTNILAKEYLIKCYKRIITILDTYMDTTRENKEIITLWVIGTYFHKDFITFPRLFINAMKGSGKSRLLQIIKSLAWNATVQSNLSEAVLFRSAAKKTMLFDESESISNKERGVLRELLNAGYKRGVEVTRMRKQTTKRGEEQIEERFDLYGPVALANINGMEDVLGDRCITLVLEKSKDQSKTKLLEDFEENVIIRDIKRTLSVGCVGFTQCRLSKKSISRYNNYIIHTLHTLYTLPTQTTQPTPLYQLKPMMLEDDNLDDFVLTEDEIEFFDEIRQLDIDGRNLELFLPLFDLARSLDKKIFEDLKVIALNYVEEKTKDDQMQNKDWSLIDFVANQPQSLEYQAVSKILYDFRNFYASDDTEWLNSAWLGRALNRLKLVVDKRRKGRGVEYVLNVSKAQEILKKFKMTTSK